MGPAGADKKESEAKRLAPWPRCRRGAERTAPAVEVAVGAAAAAVVVIVVAVAAVTDFKYLTFASGASDPSGAPAPSYSLHVTWNVNNMMKNEDVQRRDNWRQSPLEWPDEGGIGGGGGPGFTWTTPSPGRQIASVTVYSCIERERHAILISASRPCVCGRPCHLHTPPAEAKTDKLEHCKKCSIS